MGAALLLAVVFAQVAGEPHSFRCETGDAPREVPCRACLVSESQADAPPLCVASGEIVRPASGRYGLRADAPGLALASNRTLTVAAVRSGRPRTHTLALSPGGLVAVPAAPDARIRTVEIVSLATGRRDRARVPRDSEVAMPAGPVVALALGDSDSVEAVSKPIEVVPDASPATLRFLPPPAGAGDLVLRLDYSDEVPRSKRDARAVAAGAPPRAADAESAPGVSPHLAMFYGLPAGRWSGELRSDYWSAEPVPALVAPRSTAGATFGHLLRRPALTVALALDASLDGEARRVSLSRCAPGEWAATGPLDPERCQPAGSSREARPVFESLEACWHVLEVEIAGRRLRRAVDLRAGTDLEEAVSLESTRLSGRVRRGQRGVAAEIELSSVENPGASLRARAAPDGTYRVSLWPQGAWRAQVLPDRMDPGDAAFFAVDATKPGPLTRDFELAPTEVRLGLVDALTKDPLPGASIAFLAYGKPRWRDADASGEVRVSGVPPGRLEVQAEAEGYRVRQAGLEVEDSASLQVFDIELSPLERENEFRAVLATGTAASLARVFVGVSSSGLERERVDCDVDGVCRLGEHPADGEGMLLAHPDAGFTVTTAGQALAGRWAALAPGGGILRLLPTRGDATADTLLQVSVAIPGATLAPTWLDNLAFAIGRPSRTSVFPGALSGFFLPGLPAGPIAVTITAARRDEGGGFGPPAVIAGPIALELPADGAIRVALP